MIHMQCAIPVYITGLFYLFIFMYVSISQNTKVKRFCNWTNNAKEGNTIKSWAKRMRHSQT